MRMQKMKITGYRPNQRVQAWGGALLALTIVAGGLFSGSASADQESGAKSAAVCARCHGRDGNSPGAYPILAGQHKEYIAKQLQLFKAGKRKNAEMGPFVGILSEQDTLDIGEYFSTQAPGKLSFQPDPAKVAAGKKLAEERLCGTCHLPNFRGMAEIPRLSRQRASYVIKQLKDYRDGVRTSDDGVMSANVKDLTNEQIEQIAHFLATQ